MKARDFVRFLVGMLLALFLIALGIAGLGPDKSAQIHVAAVIFIAGGAFLSLRIAYRLIKKLINKN